MPSSVAARSIPAMLFAFLALTLTLAGIAGPALVQGTAAAAPAPGQTVQVEAASITPDCASCGIGF